MSAANGPLAISAAPPRLRLFAKLVEKSPQPLLEVLVPFDAPKLVNGGSVCFVFEG